VSGATDGVTPPADNALMGDDDVETRWFGDYGGVRDSRRKLRNLTLVGGRRASRCG
jgi:hypothetical protein